MSPHIQVALGYKRQTLDEIILSAGAAIKGLPVSVKFHSPPVDPKVVQTTLDELIAARAAQANGGPGATAVKNQKRAELDAMMIKLAHYVQDNCDGDAAAVLNAGFTLVTFSRTSSPLAKPTIAGIAFGNTTQLVVTVNPVARARNYEVQTAALGPDGAPGPYQSRGFFTNSRAMTVTGLTPGAIYSIQVRALGGSTQTTDWSNPVSHRCN